MATDRVKAGKDLVPLIIDNGSNSFSIQGKPYKITDTTCTCPDFLIRRTTCKHRWAILFYQEESLKLKVDNLSALVKHLDSVGGSMNEIDFYNMFDNLVDDALKTKTVVINNRRAILVR